MDEVRTGEGLYRGTEPCVVRILRGKSRRGTRQGYYIEWGSKAGGAEFGVRCGPFPSFREALSEVEAKTRGTVEWRG